LNSDEINAHLSSIPELNRFNPADIKATRLSGLTNTNFRLQINDQDWVLRIPKPETNGQIDRKAEIHNQQIANQLGIAPLPVWRDSSGASLTPTLKNTRPIKAAELDCAEKLKLILAPVQRLHRSGVRFIGEPDLKETTNQYFSMLSDTMQEALGDRMSEARAVFDRINESDCEVVASHNDLVLENCLAGRQSLWLIDWEFSGMASPYWDLATLCNAADLDPFQSNRLLECYCADGAQMEASLLFDYRTLLQLLSDCWMAAVVHQ
jgi:thiamine kinase-like enzyme